MGKDWDSAAEGIGILGVFVVGFSLFIGIYLVVAWCSPAPTPAELFTKCSEKAVTVSPLDMGARERYIRLCMGKPEVDTASGGR